MPSYEEDVCHAIAASLDQIEGLHQSAFILSNAMPPVAEVIPGAITPHETMGNGMSSMAATVRVTVGSAGDRAAQARLMAFRSPSGEFSVREALEQDLTLGGLVEYLQVVSIGEVRQFRRPDGELVLGCDFVLDVNTTG